VIARTLLALALLALPARADEAGELARAAREARRSGDAPRALLLLEARPALAGDLRVAGERLLALIDAHRLDDARAADAALGEVREGPPPLAIARARLAVAGGGAAAALHWAEAAGTLRDNPDLALARLEALLALGRWKDAEAALAALPAATHDALRRRAAADLRLARARELAEDPELLERAVPLLEEALALQPGRPDLCIALVEVLAQWHRAERAEELAQSVLAGAPDGLRAEMLVALGQVRRAELRDAEAVACFDEALRLRPALPGALLGLARCHLRAGDLPAAEARLRQRLSGAPRDAEALLLLAELELERRAPERAEGPLREVLAARPHNLKALWLLSRALALQGRRDEQRETLAVWQDRRELLAGP